MFQLLITVNLKSSVGAGVAISSIVLNFESKAAADIAYSKLMNISTRTTSPAWTSRTVEKLYAESN